MLNKLAYYFIMILDKLSDAIISIEYSIEHKAEKIKRNKKFEDYVCTNCFEDKKSEIQNINKQKVIKKCDKCGKRAIFVN